MLNDLPNELIREVLFPVLDIPDEMLRDTSEISPFSRPSHISASSILGVCKTWMSVGTPILYSIVVLRSKAQAFALIYTLHKHRELGHYIKKLRIEGGYGHAMYIIINAAPNVTDLCISLNIHVSEGVEGLCSSIESINPCCVVVLTPSEPRRNLPSNKLAMKLSSCLKSWTNLTEVYLSLSGIRAMPSSSLIIDGLVEAPNLQTITSPAFYDEPLLRKLAESTSLKAIRFISPHAISDTQGKSLIRDPTVQKLLVVDPVYPSPPAIRPALPSNPAFVPLPGVSSDIRDVIWSHVLRFAFQVDICSHELLDQERVRTLSHVNQTRLSVPQVCRDFRRLAHPYTFGFPIFIQHEDIARCAAGLIRNPSLGTHLRSIQFRGVFLSSSSRRLGQIFLRAPQLQQLRSIKCPPDMDVDDNDWTFSRLFITWAAFQALANTSGPVLHTLQDISVVQADGLVCPSIFGRFLVLRHLQCGMFPHFNKAGNMVQKHYLSTLESIQLWACHSSFLDILSLMDLPSLRELEIVPVPPGDDHRISQTHLVAFLKIHGSKIRSLRVGHLSLPVFDLCPNMICLKMTMSSSAVTMFHDETIYDSLEKIVIDDRAYLSRSTHDLDTMTLLSSLQLSHFPKLREIQLLALRWPASELEIFNSSWPRCSERLAKRNVTLTNKHGCHWRPRLQREWASVF